MKILLASLLFMLALVPAFGQNVAVMNSGISTQTGSNYAIQCADSLKLLELSNASAQTPTMPAASTCGAGVVFRIENHGAGTQTITPATSSLSYFSGGSWQTGKATLPLVQGQMAEIYNDGANYVAFVHLSGKAIGTCTVAWGGSGTSHALTSGDDAVVNNTCYNDSGVTRTITAVKCRSDNGSNTTTVNPTFGSAGTGTTILSGALTCGNSYAYSSSGTVSNASWTTGTGIDPAMGGTLTGTSVAVIIEYTY